MADVHTASQPRIVVDVPITFDGFDSVTWLNASQPWIHRRVADRLPPSTTNPLDPTFEAMSNDHSPLLPRSALVADVTLLELATVLHPPSKTLSMNVEAFGQTSSYIFDAPVRHIVTGDQVAIQEMHHNVAVRSDKLHQQVRGRYDRKTQAKFADFSVGESCHVTRVITDRVIETQELVPPYEVTLDHSCRLKIYHEVGGEVIKALEWRGLDVEASSMKPAANLVDEIPVVLRKWAAANKEDPAHQDNGLSVGRKEFCRVQSNWIPRRPLANTHSVCV
ncbi:hypothetical protein H257_01012 [Aphanomyces astaci]|uniref:Uncharacterized protein n=1 Tax=Aphanomyces astaci TaxID=112090 RepID=W4H5Y1_APHAT|nr:hypothetical protein H257_01012 [Aphanomyces astaci]ETV87430.1 hypothetical protein H257_01012 [Aphanomyces astaci]|eukprot:XP_009822293.1 hypothetical protein H257_01012 [Aphanomyces astaci]